MKVPYLALGWQAAGTQMVAKHSGGQAFVELLDASNFQLLARAQVHTFYGGPMAGAEWEFEIPYDDSWYIAGTGDGQLQVDQLMPGLPAGFGTRNSNLTAPGTVTGSGSNFIASEAEPNTDAVDTRALAEMAADELQRDPQNGGATLANIQLELASLDRDLVDKFNVDFSNVVMMLGNASVGAGHALVKEGRLRALWGYNILVENPKVRAILELTFAKYANEGGITPEVEQFLKKLGIEVSTGVNPAPRGSVGKPSNPTRSTASKASNHNGKLAENAIADRYRAAGYEVSQHVIVHENGERTVNGKRTKNSFEIDIQADKSHPTDPRLNERLEVESKAKRLNSIKDIRSQAEAASARLDENSKLRAAGESLEKNGARLARIGGKVLRPLGVVMDAIAIGQAVHEDGNRFGEKAQRTTAGVAGGLAGAAAGAAIGASVGSVIPVAGTLVGGIVGGAVGGIVGSGVGEKAYDAGKKVVGKVLSFFD